MAAWGPDDSRDALDRERDVLHDWQRKPSERNELPRKTLRASLRALLDSIQFDQGRRRRS